MGTAGATVLACLWTFEFALPASIEWSDATAQAQALRSRLQYSPENVHGTVPVQPCIVQTAGSVGPLPAPYKEFAYWTPMGHAVSFTASGANSSGGLVYTDRPCQG